MDLEGEGARTPKMELEAEGALNAKMKGAGNHSSKDMIFRADKIDLKSLDAQLEKHLSRVWSRSIETKRPTEEWEIDLAKLDLRYVVAHGAYGTVYRGTYDNQDVAGICNCTYLSICARVHLRMYVCNILFVVYF